MVAAFGANHANLRGFYICPKDRDNITLFGDFYTARTNIFAVYILPCDKSKRKTCRSRDEIVKFLRRSLIDVIGLQSVVVEDQFSSLEG